MDHHFSLGNVLLSFEYVFRAHTNRADFTSVNSTQKLQEKIVRQNETWFKRVMSTTIDSFSQLCNNSFSNHLFSPTHLDILFIR
jgi:hypothetical protein